MNQECKNCSNELSFIEFDCKHTYCFNCFYFLFLNTSKISKDFKKIICLCEKGELLINQNLVDLTNNYEIIIKCCECKKKSIYSCQNCSLNFCLECFEKHKTMESFESHIISKPTFFDKCEQHGFFNMLYCENCCIKLCFSCINTHKNHSLNSFFEQKNDILNKFKGVLDLKIQTTNTEFDIAKEKIENLTTKIKSALVFLEDLTLKTFSKYEKIKKSVDFFDKITKNITKCNFENFNKAKLDEIFENLNSKIAKFSFNDDFLKDLNKLLSQKDFFEFDFLGKKHKKNKK